MASLGARAEHQGEKPPAAITRFGQYLCAASSPKPAVVQAYKRRAPFVRKHLTDLDAKLPYSGNPSNVA